MCDYEVPRFGVQQGWQCPICKRVYAPFMSECPYCGRYDSVVTNIGTISQEVDWSKLYKEYTSTTVPKVILNGTERLYCEFR